MSAPLDLSTRRDFSLENYLDVAWKKTPATFSQMALDKITASRDTFMAFLDSDEHPVIYGVTSGYGQMAKNHLTPEERKKHAATLTHVPATSFGEPLPDRIVRGITFARLVNFVEGHSAITPELALKVSNMLSDETQPFVPALGNGTAGEIQALAWLFADLKNRWTLAEKESLALVNGSPCATALVCDASLVAERRLDLAVQVFALSVEAIRGPLDAYAPELEDLWNDPAQSRILKRLRALLQGGCQPRRSYQAPVSWRILPRVLGHASRAVEQAQDVAARSLQAITDNPLFLPPDEEHPSGLCLSTGGFHNASAYPVLDDLAACWADLALLADRHVSKLLDESISGLPDMLMSPGANPYGGEEAYLGCFGMTAAGFSEQARQAAQRTFLPGSEGGAYGANDVGVPTFLAWRKECEAGRCLEANLAILATVASQALHVTGREAPIALRPLLDEVRASFPPPEPDEFMATKMEYLFDTFTKKTVTA